MSAKRLERHVPYVDDSGEVSHFTCHKCGKGYYGDDSSSQRFRFCPMCGMSIDHSEFVPRNAEKQRRKALRSSSPRLKPENREYHIRIERADGQDIFDHYNRKPHGKFWTWYACGCIVGGLSLAAVSERGCKAVLESFHAHCDRFAKGYRGYMEAEMALPAGEYRLILMRDGVPTISRIVSSIQPR